MAEFGFMSTVAGSRETLSKFDGFRNDRRDDICAGAAMMLSDKFWFHNVSDSITEPFRFAGGCILPPNQLVIKYVSALSPKNQSNKDEEREEVEVTSMVSYEDKDEKKEENEATAIAADEDKVENEVGAVAPVASDRGKEEKEDDKVTEIATDEFI